MDLSSIVRTSIEREYWSVTCVSVCNWLYWSIKCVPVTTWLKCYSYSAWQVGRWAWPWASPTPAQHRLTQKGVSLSLSTRLYHLAPTASPLSLSGLRQRTSSLGTNLKLLLEGRLRLPGHHRPSALQSGPYCTSDRSTLDRNVTHTLLYLQLHSILETIYFTQYFNRKTAFFRLLLHPRHHNTRTTTHTSGLTQRRHDS